MSCHISALCIALPRPKTRTGGDHFGERNSWRVETTPISPPSKHQQHLSLFLHPMMAGGGDTFEESTFHVTPQFLTQKEEFSTYPSSGLCWRDTQHVEGEACGWATYFQVSVATPLQCPPWRIGSQAKKRVLCCISCVLYSWS